MGTLGNLSYLNPFSSKFIRNDRFDRNLTKQLEDNSAGISDVEFDLNKLGMKPPDVGSGTADVFQRFVNFHEVFTSKRERIAKYRSMAYYPEISEALDIVCDESIVSDSEGKIAHLNILKEIPKRVYHTYLREFDYIMNDVLCARENLYDLYYKWLVEAELYVELIVDKNQKKGLIGYKTLPAFTTFPIYNTNGKIVGYAQSSLDMQGKPELIPFVGNQISYVHWGKYGRDLLDIRGYLEPSVRTYNQLKNLEDSLIVYRLVRAPERRVWNIEVGRLPTQKADQFIRKIIHKYKKQSSYNPSTGNIDSSRNVHSLSEDFWFAQRDGQGTSVDTIGGGMQLGELEDVRYFLTKMYKTLKLPKTRWDPNIGQSQYQSGRDMDREELKFTLFIERAQNRFKKLIKDMFLEHIKFKYGSDKRFNKYLKPSLFDINFTPANFFKEMKDMELLEARLNILGTAISYASSPEDPEQPFSREFILRRYFRMSDEEYAENQKLLNPEKEENRAIAQEEIEMEQGAGEAETPAEEPKPDSGDKDKDVDKAIAGAIVKDIEQEDEEVEYPVNPNDVHLKKNIKDFLQKKKPNRKRII